MLATRAAHALPFPSRLPAPVLRVRPVEGLLVLFPSYFYHRTIPFGGDGPFDSGGTRISVAFDFVPAASTETRVNA